MKFKTWKEFEAYLDELGLFRMEPGLERIGAVLEDLGLKRTPFALAQGVGTNGKGSACTFLASLARAHGLVSGLHSSPHFTSVRERVRIFRPAQGPAGQVADRAAEPARTGGPACAPPQKRGGELLPEADWLEAANLVMRRGGERLTYFELVTTLAVVLMNKAGVDLAVMETGLGGRFDATTALDADLVFFTPIDLDHAEVLGPTLREVARDKAGAMRPGVPAISAAQRPEARQELEAAAGKLAVPLSFIDGVAILPEALQPRRRSPAPDSPGPAKGAASGSGTKPARKDDHHHDEPPAPQAAASLILQGRHQLDNAALALRAWRELRGILSGRGRAAGLPAESARTAAGLPGGEANAVAASAGGSAASASPASPKTCARTLASAEFCGLTQAWLPGRMQFIEPCGLGRPGGPGGPDAGKAGTESALENGPPVIEAPACSGTRPNAAGTSNQSTGKPPAAPCRLPHPPLIIDGAHNPHGMAALGHSLALMGIAPAVTIFSCLADKQPEKLAPHLRVLSGGLILVPQIQDHPRAMNAAELAGLIGRPALAVPDLASAIRIGTASLLERLPEAAEQSIHDCKYPMLICGSLYLLAEFFGLYPEYLE